MIAKMHILFGFCMLNFLNIIWTNIDCKRYKTPHKKIKKYFKSPVDNDLSFASYQQRYAIFFSIKQIKIFFTDSISTDTFSIR